MVHVNMSLNDKQFEALVKQLEQKKAKLGDDEYNQFLQRAAQVQAQPEQPSDNDGFLMDTAQGVAKSAGDVVLGVGTIGRGIQRGVSKAVGAIFGQNNPLQMGQPNVFDAGSQANTKAKEVLARDTSGEKFGGFVGDVASFAVPGGAVTKATKGANFLTRAAALGASDGLVTTVRQGEFNKNSVDSAIIGAAFPIVGAGLSTAKAAAIRSGYLPSGKDVGGRVVNSLIKPLLKDFSYGKNPGQAVAEAGIVANSLDDLASKITTARQEVGEQIAAKVAGAATKFDATDALKPIDEALEAAKKSPRTNAAVIGRLQDLKADILRTDADGVAARKLTDLTGDELWELNKDIGELTRWTGNATDDEIVNKALQKAYSGTRSKLEKGVSGLDDISEKYANLKSAEVATIYRDKIAQRQGLIGFGGQQAGIATGLITAAATGGITVPLIVGAGTAGLIEASKTPAFKTRLAAWLANTSKDQLKDAFKQAPWLRGTLQTILLDVDEAEQDQTGQNDPSN